MESYRVLLADDEEDIRVGISRKIDWTGLGFTLVGEAENGQEALELADQLKPDVVLTDIKMPFMDGLELCRLLTQKLPASKFVVFSGFDDFEYAKQAIRLNVSEYILKPINAPELTAVMRRIKDQLDEERAARRDLEQIRRRYEESLPVLRERFLTRLLDGRLRPEQVAERAAWYDLDFKAPFWVAALIHCDETRERTELLALSVQAFLEENLQLEGCAVKTFLYGDDLALLTGFQSRPPLYDLIEELNRVCKLARSYLNLTLTVGVGAPCRGAAELAQSAAGARSALDYRVLLGAGRAVYIGDLEPGGTERLTFDENDERELTWAVKLGEEAEIRTVAGRLVDKIREAGLSLSQCHLYFLELFTCLLKLTRGSDLEVAAVFGPDFTGVVQITDFKSPDELEAWFLEKCARIRKLIDRKRTDSAGRMVERAKDFIGQHYMESDLSVERLCDFLHLSPAYFSTLFKRETGMSFTNYVTVVRMDQAADLLRGTEEKTYLIAEKTGYADPNYFSYVFKKHFGVSPTKYRAG